MGVYIRGMEMPTSCLSCPCKTADAFGGLGCQATGYIPLRKADQDRPDWCPLVPVPPHGRLIEESKVLDIVSAWCPDDDGSVGKDGDLREMLDEIEALPTIILADPAEEG